MSTFNGEDCIYDQMKSIADQTVKPDDVIISDDGSNDSTCEIVRKFIAEHSLSNWKLIENGINRGWKKNFKDLITNENYDICFLSDQDDVWYSKKIDLMLKVMIKNPDIEVLTSKYTNFVNEIKPEEYKTTNVNKIKLDYSFFDVKDPGCTYCFRKSIISICQNGWLDSFAHDAVLWRVSIIRGTLYEYENPLIFWRQHSDSAYKIESKKNRKLKMRIKWTNDAIAFAEYLRTISYKNIDKETVYNILNGFKEYINQKKRAFQRRSIIDWVKLLKYHKYFYSIRQYLGDLYAILQ
jgi:glycosyltransferase involved in cell wall biosynthesis